MEINKDDDEDNQLPSVASLWAPVARPILTD